MQQSLAAIRLAIRVLTAITNRQHPASADVEELRRLAQDSSRLPPDELACEVIQGALRRIARVRNEGAA
jgi:hypothetical protein